MPFVIQDILPEGTMLITGKPKTRKSWLALNYSFAVACGGKALGHFQALKGDVLYIDLEMGAKRIHKRLHVVSPDMAPPQGFQFATNWPRIGAGFETWLMDYLKRYPFTRLVVVDTLIGIRAVRKKYEDPYEADKAFTQTLTNICHEFHIAMLLVHHSRKADGSDITDDASGSTGLTGGVDTSRPEGEAEALRKVASGSNDGMVVLTQNALQSQLDDATRDGMVRAFAAIYQGGYIVPGKVSAVKQALFGVSGGRKLQALNAAIDAVVVPPSMPEPPQITPIAQRPVPNGLRFAGDARDAQNDG